MGYNDRHLANAAARQIVNVSRRFVLGAGAATSLVLAFGIPLRRALGQDMSAVASDQAARNVEAFLKIAPDGTLTFYNPFIEGGQGVDTAIPQIIAEELDADMAQFRVEVAPVGPEYRLLAGGKLRLTGGSMTIRMTYPIWRTVGATARAMLIAAAAQEWGVPAAEITTARGSCLHAKSKRQASYGALAATAAGLTPPTTVTLKAPAQFRLIGKPVKRLDVPAKSTGRTQYGIDVRLDGMLYGAVRHAPRIGAEAATIGKQEAAKALPGVHAVLKLPSAVGVVADSFYRAKKALELLDITWDGGTIPADFSSAGMLDTIKAKFDTDGIPVETKGDVAGAFKSAAHVIEAEYDVPYLAHATMEPQNSTARFNEDGTLDLWVPNQGPDPFQAAAARETGIDASKIRIHSPPLGGFFGRRSYYGQEPMSQAILMAKATGKPVKVVWTREEDIGRDFFRPLSAVKARAAFGAGGKPAAIHFTAPGEGPGNRFFHAPADPTVFEGLTDKPYAIANRRVDFVLVTHPTNIGFWRSVGHSMNDFFYESFLDEIALEAKQDPYAFRLALLQHSPRHLSLLKTVAQLAGGWKPGVYTVGGSKRAMGVAMASPFGSEVTTIAEVSLPDGEITVHHLWVAVDPGMVVNPAIVRAQIESGCAMGLSQALLEQITFTNGTVGETNFSSYHFLPPDRMPQVHVEIVQSGAPIGGIGEIGVPSVAPAVANAVATLTGERLRSLPLSKHKLKTA